MHGTRLIGMCLGVLLILLARLGAALELALPVDCTIGYDCIIQNYVDVDSSEAWQDYNCGSLTYDGHKGTDFRIRDYQAMRAGVAVRAAASGVVLGVRNNIEDRRPGEDYEHYLQNISGKECGNGLVLVHEDNYQTQYCHMRNSSVAVKTGDKIKQGDFLGYIGMSGKTQFPHLHISVRQGSKVISPFAGPCSTTSASLWQDQPAYTATFLLKYGFTDAVPDLESIEEGAAATPSRNAPIFLFWANLVDVKQGDIQEITITRPDGRILVSKAETLKKSKVNWLSYVGRKKPAGGWPGGTYTARYVLKRGSAAIIETAAELVVE